ncbi:MAG: right-handed parallel beta-helix repeat-containing protein [Promethearchaeota archaeon]
MVKIIKRLKKIRKIEFGIFMLIFVFVSILFGMAESSKKNSLINMPYPSSELHLWINIKNKDWEDTNKRLDEICGEMGTDGLSWESAHIIENYSFDIGIDFHSYYFPAISVENTSRHLIIRNCTFFNSKSIDIKVPVIELIGCQNIRLIGCKIENTNSKYGLWIENSDDIAVINCSVSNCNYNFYLSNSTNITLNNNNFTDDKYYNLYLYRSEAVSVIDNRITSSSNNIGIYLFYSDNNLIYNNEVSHNGQDGIYLKNSDSNRITENTITYNPRYGIYIQDSDENTINKNNMFSNGENCNIFSGFNNRVDENKKNNVIFLDSIPGFDVCFIIVFGMLGVIILYTYKLSNLSIKHIMKIRGKK